MRETNTHNRRTRRTPLRSIPLLVLLLFLTGGLSTNAEGSRDLVDSGLGQRPFIEWAPNTTLAGIARATTLHTYARQGETLYLGSSVPQSYDSKDIVVTPPNGNQIVLDVKTDGTGLIDTSQKELRGPRTPANTKGYAPLTVLADQTGWWTIEFHGPVEGNDSVNPAPVGVTGNRFYSADAEGNKTAQGDSVAAWDITVIDAAGTIKDGRTFSYYLSLNMGNNFRSLYSKLYVLTKDGFQYEVDLNGIDPYGFGFFSNNRGFWEGSGTDRKTLYRSVELLDFSPQGGIQMQNPLAADTATDRTHRIFFNRPSADLPSDIPTSPLPLPEITTNSFVFNGRSDVPGSSGSRSDPGAGGTFAFEANRPGAYQILVDTNRDQQFDPVVDRVLENTFESGLNSVEWDGRDARGQILPEGSYDAQLIIKGGEVHFPMLDVESAPQGIKLTALNQPSTPPLPAGTTAGTVYWNDENYTTAAGRSISFDPVANQTAANPRNGTKGQDSLAAGVHGYTGGYGNNKGFDLWSYFPGASYGTQLTVTPMVSGQVFLDRNGNGSLDADENGYAAIELTLTGADGIEQTIQTDENGSFSFVSGSGSIGLRLENAENYEVTTDNAEQTVQVDPDRSGTFEAIGLNLTSTSPPAIVAFTEDTGASNTDRITRDNTPVLQGTAEPGSLITVYEESEPTVILGSTTADAVSGEWSLSDWASSPLSDGTYYLIARAEVSPKPISLPSASFTITVDTTAPSLTLDRPVEQAVLPSGAIELAGTAEEGSELLLSIDVGAYTTMVTEASGSPSHWQFTLQGGLSPGAHTLLVRAVDLAGNTTTTGVSFTVEPAIASELRIQGADSLVIPAVGAASIRSVYSAVYGEPPAPFSEEVVWSIQGTGLTGVTIDAISGELILSSSAIEGLITLEVSSLSDPDLRALKTVLLIKSPPTPVNPAPVPEEPVPAPVPTPVPPMTVQPETVPETSNPLTPETVENNEEEFGDEGTHIRYIYGHPDGTFQPDRAITRAEVAAILTRITESGNVPEVLESRYADVPANSWAVGYIEQVAELGIMTGTPDGGFQPSRIMTRGELAVISARFGNLSTYEDASFADASGHWAEKEIGAAAEAGWIKGYPGNVYRPNDPVSRAELVTVMNRMLGRGPVVSELTPSWPDVPSNYWAFDDIMEASIDHDYIRDEDGERWNPQ